MVEQCDKWYELWLKKGSRETGPIKVKDMILKQAIDERRERNAEALADSASV